MHQPPRGFRGALVVGDHDDGLVQLGVEAGHQLEHVGRGDPVQVPGGFIGHQDRGSVMIARAIATRCCWPPDSSDGKWDLRSDNADHVERRGHVLPALARDSRVSSSGSSTFSKAVSTGSRL